MTTLGPVRTGAQYRLRQLTLALVCGLLAAACTGSGDGDDDASVPSATDRPATTSVAPPATVPEVGDLPGALAIGGLQGLVIAEPDGTGIVSAPVAGAEISAQPTWSRDGSRAVAFLPNATGGRVVVVEADPSGAGESSWLAEARRPYFFFSWSGDGRYIAALGPGPRGTTLDILTAEGELATEQALDTRSFYLAWEPGGDDLVIHRDRSLELVRDPLDLDDREPLGSPGQSFLAPAWIPGTREVVIVDGDAGGSDLPRLLRLDVDTGDEIELGVVGGQAGFVVSPDGSRLFLTHGDPDPDADADGGVVSAAFGRTVRAQAALSETTELVDLDDGTRTQLNDQLSLWAEWSPDGSAVVFLQAGTDGGAWRLVDDRGLRDVADGVRLSSRFFRSYVFFAWQYVETPRIWSPAGDAIVYAAGNEGVTGIFVHPIDGDPERVSAGDVAFWSPAAVTGASAAT